MAHNDCKLDVHRIGSEGECPAGGFSYAMAERYESQAALDNRRRQLLQIRRPTQEQNRELHELQTEESAEQAIPQSRRVYIQLPASEVLRRRYETLRHTLQHGTRTRARQQQLQQMRDTVERGRDMCFDVADLYHWLQANPVGALPREFGGCTFTEPQKTAIRRYAESLPDVERRAEERLTLGAQASAEGIGERTDPLARAIAQGDVAALHRMLQQDSDLKGPALQLAVDANSLRVVQFLVENGHAHADEALLQASREGNIPIVEWLLRTQRIPTEDIQNAYVNAAHQGKLLLVQRFQQLARRLLTPDVQARAVQQANTHGYPETGQWIAQYGVITSLRMNRGAFVERVQRQQRLREGLVRKIQEGLRALDTGTNAFNQWLEVMDPEEQEEEDTRLAVARLTPDQIREALQRLQANATDMTLNNDRFPEEVIMDALSSIAYVKQTVSEGLQAVSDGQVRQWSNETGIGQGSVEYLTEAEITRVLESVDIVTQDLDDLQQGLTDAALPAKARVAQQQLEKRRQVILADLQQGLAAVGNPQDFRQWLEKRLATPREQQIIFQLHRDAIRRILQSEEAYVSVPNPNNAHLFQTFSDNIVDDLMAAAHNAGLVRDAIVVPQYEQRKAALDEQSRALLAYMQEGKQAAQDNAMSAWLATLPTSSRFTVAQKQFVAEQFRTNYSARNRMVIALTRLEEVHPYDLALASLQPADTMFSTLMDASRDAARVQ